MKWRKAVFKKNFFLRVKKGNIIELEMNLFQDLPWRKKNLKLSIKIQLMIYL